MSCNDQPDGDQQQCKDRPERLIESDAVSTPAGALSMARMQYGRLRLPTETVQVRVPVRPDLDYRDPVILRRDRSGVGGTYQFY